MAEEDLSNFNIYIEYDIFMAEENHQRHTHRAMYHQLINNIRIDL